MNPRQEALIEHLLLQDAIEIDSIDNQSGEMLYKIKDKMKEVSPEIFQQLTDQYKHHMFQLIDQGPTRMTWRLR
jgi:hypothetical protein